MRFGLNFPHRSPWRRKRLARGTAWPTAPRPTIAAWIETPRSASIAVLARSVIALTLVIAVIDGRVEFKAAQDPQPVHQSALK